MGDLKRSIRIKEELISDIERIASARGATTTQVINDALALYRDYYYTKEKATVIPEETVKVLQASLDLLEQRLNRKTNTVLSELAIQQCIMARIIADGLEVNPMALDEYRRQAVNYLKEGNQVFRMTPDLFE